MDNTTILVYGTSDENKKKIAEEFDWGQILSGSEIFTRNEFNPNIYEQGDNYSISAYGKKISVHPGDASSVKRAIEDLIPVVSKHYHCRCHISGNFSHFTVSISMISDKECISQGIETGEREAVIDYGYK